MLEASILIYSGLENPRWTIVGAAEQMVLAQLEGLPSAPCGPAELAGLGYSGVELVREREVGKVESWTLYGGTAAHNGKCFEDRGRRLERLVMGMGRAALGDKVPEGLI